MFGVLSAVAITWFVTYTWCRISHKNRTFRLRRSADGDTLPREQ